MLEWIRTIAVARICCPTSYVRLSAGRESLSDSEQALAFMAGANSFFYGDKLLTTGNASQSGDDRLMRELGPPSILPHKSAQSVACDGCDERSSIADGIGRLVWLFAANNNL